MQIEEVYYSDLNEGEKINILNEWTEEQVHEKGAAFLAVLKKIVA